MTAALNTVAKPPAASRFVVMLVYPGVVAMDIFGPLEAFATANAIAHQPLYRLGIAGQSLGPAAPPPRRLRHAHRRRPRTRATRCSCRGPRDGPRRAATSVFSPG